jgi:hypothetical protein
MDRARAAHLIAGSLAGNEADQPEHFGHGDPGPDFSEANTGHGKRSQDTVAGHCGRRGDVTGAEKRNP